MAYLRRFDAIRSFLKSFLAINAVFGASAFTPHMAVNRGWLTLPVYPTLPCTQRIRFRSSRGFAVIVVGVLIALWVNFFNGAVREIGDHRGVL